MSEQHDIRSRYDSQFRSIAFRVLDQAGFTPYVPEEKDDMPRDGQEILKKDENIYCVETFYSRRVQYTSRAILNAAECLINHTKEKGWLPLIVVGGTLPVSLRGDLLGRSIRTVILDIENLLCMASKNRELYDELVAQLPYSPDGLKFKEPDYLPLPDWNAAYAGKNDWEISVSAFRPERDDTAAPPPKPMPDINGSGHITPDNWEEDPRGHLRAAGTGKGERIIGITDEEIDDFFEEWDGGDLVIEDPTDDGKPFVFATDASHITVDLGSSAVDLSKIRRAAKQEAGVDYRLLGNPGTGKSSSIAMHSFLFLQNEAKQLRKDITNWKSGKQTNASAYEKLCTRTLIRLFADDLTLWNEQAKSNANLYRFDLICKIKRENHKDFWEIVERYFDSKYVIFEFKNYTEKVTQKEVYTTLRYLYPTALRRVAIIISPNGIDDHADKAIRGALRDEGKLILSLTNEELLHMLQMKEDGEDPADYLSDKLDALLIDLEK